MADVRIKEPVRIVDAVTDANSLNITAAGEALVSLNTAIPAGANNIGDVDIAGGLTASDAALTANPVTIGGRASTATPTAVSADGDVVDIWLSRTGAVQVDVLSGGGGPEDSDDGSIAGAQTVGLNAALLYGWDGTAWERIETDTTNRMVVAAETVDGVAGEGTALGNGMLIQGDDGTDRTNVLVDAAGHLQVDVLTGGGSNTPTNPTVEALSASAVAAGGTGFLDSAEITEAEKLWRAYIAATVPFKYRIGFQENTVRNAQTGWMFGQAGTVVQWEPSHPDFYTHAGASGGTDTIYIEYFNMDNELAADIHGTLEYAT